MAKKATRTAAAAPESDEMELELAPEPTPAKKAPLKAPPLKAPPLKAPAATAAKKPAGKAPGAKAPVKPAAGKKKTKAQIHRETCSPEGFASGKLQALTSGLLTDVLGDMRQTHDDVSICTASDAGAVVIGIPLPSLAMEFLLQNTVWPLGRLTQTVGLEGSFKSALQWEIARWFRKYGAGVATVFEAESKFSPDYARSFTGWPEPDWLGHVPVHTVEDWQTKIQDFHERVKTRMLGTKADPGPGRTFAVLTILDSIMGKLSEKTITKIETEGHTDRRYATEAAFITDFFKKFPSDLAKWPIAFNAVNHLKLSKDDMGQDVRRKAGGAQVSFQETFELEMKRAGKIYRSGYKAGAPEIDGRKLTITCFKNSLGITDRQIPVDVLWYTETDTNGRQRQISYFDWHAATIQFLLKLKDVRQTRLREIIQLNPVAGDKVWCKQLDIKQSNPISQTEAGLLLHQHKELKNTLRKHFGIKPRRRFKPGVDYLQQLNQEHLRVGKKLAMEEDDAVPV